MSICLLLPVFDDQPLALLLDGDFLPFLPAKIFDDSIRQRHHIACPGAAGALDFAYMLLSDFFASHSDVYLCIE